MQGIGSIHHDSEEDAFGGEDDSSASIHTETTGQNNASGVENEQVGEHGASNMTELDDGMDSDQIGIGAKTQEDGSDTQRQINLEDIAMVPVRTDGQHLSNSNDSNIGDNQQHFTTNGEENNGGHSQLRGGRSGGGKACTVQTTIPQTIGFHETK